MEIRNLNDFIKPPHLPELSDMEALGSIYESPITLVAGEMQTTMEANCLKVVQSYGFDVNAEELAKALAYDRDQYDKGYAAARKKYEKPRGKWKTDDMTGIKDCDQCGRQAPIDITSGLFANSPFCPWCGATMEPEEEEHGPQ